jgi:hypothetical protein
VPTLVPAVRARPAAAALGRRDDELELARRRRVRGSIERDLADELCRCARGEGRAGDDEREKGLGDDHRGDPEDGSVAGPTIVARRNRVKDAPGSHLERHAG